MKPGSEKTNFLQFWIAFCIGVIDSYEFICAFICYHDEAIALLVQAVVQTGIT